MKYYICLSWISLYFYMVGFFLTRKELLLESSCNEVNKISTCLSPKFDRVIMLIIDALRLDMITSVDVNNNLNFPYMNSLLLSNVSYVHLFGFEADPPTTTSQRLKALTTGSLPTFLDISQNFNSKSIKEDNIIDQLKKFDRKLTVLGDDTWSSLYPNQFNNRIPFDSFNTRDIHTVDDGIEKHIWNQFHNESWDVFIAHFLGVDHIGHTYSSFHPMMSQRLQRMDSILQKTVESMDNDTILLLFGDHGMTDDGNHGGSSYEELTSALFVYSKKVIEYESNNELCKLSSNKKESYHKRSWDKDKGEFISVDKRKLLNNPRMIKQIDLVPTISLLLGIPIPFSNLGKIIPELFDSDRNLLNAFFLNSMQVIAYFQNYFATNMKEIHNILNELNEDNDRELISIVDYCLNQKDLSFSYCFQDFFIMHYEDNHNSSTSTYMFRIFHKMLVVFQEYGRKKWTEFDAIRIVTGMILLFFSIDTVLKKFQLKDILSTKHNSSISIYTRLSLVFAVIFALSSLSNSFIDEEKRLLFVFVQALNIVLLLDLAFIQNDFNANSSIYVLILTVICIFYARCAWSSHLSDNSISFITSNIYVVYILWAKLILLSTSIVIRDMERHFINILSLLLFITCQLLLLYHLDFSSNQRNKSINIYLIPRFVCILSFVGLSCPCLMKNTYSNTLHVLIHTFSICILVFLAAKGQRKPGTLFSSLLSFGFSLEIMRYYLNNKSTKLSESSISIFIGWVIHMCLFARLLFYFTGHQYAFSSLQLDSGFILSDSFNFYTAGMMLAINTFISEVFGILIILVLVSYIKRFDKNQGKKKEMIILTITLFKLSTVFCSCLSAFILRRHLMVWAVFAPKVIFEVSFWLVSSLILLFT